MDHFLNEGGSRDKEFTPVVEVVNFGILDKSISDKFKFRKEIEQICGSGAVLPEFFPSVPDYKAARENGNFVSFIDKRKNLNLPRVLLNSDTFSQRLELRGLVEEIIIAYSHERESNDMPPFKVIGNGWSESFKNRLNRLSLISEQNGLEIERFKEGEEEINKDQTQDTRTGHTHEIPFRFNNQGLKVVRGKIMPTKRSS